MVYAYKGLGFKVPAALKERCPPRQKSRVERLKAKVEPLLTYLTVDSTQKATGKAFPAARSSRHAVRREWREREE